MSEMIQRRQTSARSKRTAVQEKLWRLFQDEKNRELSISAVCRKMGCRGQSSWYHAIQDQAFRTELEALEQCS